MRENDTSCNEDSINEIESATTEVDLSALTPTVVWAAFVGGERLDATWMALLPGLFLQSLELSGTEDLDAAFARLVRQAPPLPTSSAAPKARLAAEIEQPEWRPPSLNYCR